MFLSQILTLKQNLQYLAVMARMRAGVAWRVAAAGCFLVRWPWRWQLGSQRGWKLLESLRETKMAMNESLLPLAIKQSQKGFERIKGRPETFWVGGDGQ